MTDSPTPPPTTPRARVEEAIMRTVEAAYDVGEHHGRDRRNYDGNEESRQAEKSAAIAALLAHYDALLLETKEARALKEVINNDGSLVTQEEYIDVARDAMTALSHSSQLHADLSALTRRAAAAERRERIWLDKYNELRAAVFASDRKTSVQLTAAEIEALSDAIEALDSETAGFINRGAAQGEEVEHATMIDCADAHLEVLRALLVQASVIPSSSAILKAGAVEGVVEWAAMRERDSMSFNARLVDTNVVRTPDDWPIGSKVRVTLLPEEGQR